MSTYNICVHGEIKKLFSWVYLELCMFFVVMKWPSVLFSLQISHIFLTKRF